MRETNESVHYFLCRQKDHYYRVGIEGSKSAAEETLSLYYDSIEYIDEFPTFIKVDIDKQSGLGNRSFDGFYIRTCKHVHQLITRKDSSNFWETLKKAHKKLKEIAKEDARTEEAKHKKILKEISEDD